MTTTKVKVSTKVLDVWSGRNSEGFISKVTVYTENTQDELEHLIRTLHPNKKYVIQLGVQEKNGKWSIIPNTYYIFYPNRIITGPCVI